MASTLVHSIAKGDIATLSVTLCKPRLHPSPKHLVYEAVLNTIYTYMQKSQNFLWQCNKTTRNVP